MVYKTRLAWTQQRKRYHKYNHDLYEVQKLIKYNEKM